MARHAVKLRFRTSVVAFAIVLTVPMSLLAAVPVRTMFVAAGEKEQTVRAALADPAAVPATVLKSLRRAVASYETVVLRYPNSSYCDNALWQAAHLSLDAFNRFGDAKDRETGLRLLRWLAKEYPTSRLAKQVPNLLTAATAAGVGSGKPNAKATAAASVVAAPKIATVSHIQRSLLPEVVRLTIAIDAEVPFHDERIAGPSRIVIDFPATRAAAALIDQTLRFEDDRDVVRHVRVGRQPNAKIRIVLDAAGVSSYSVYPMYNPYRLVIDCVRDMPVGALASTSPPKPGATTDSARAKPGVNLEPVRARPDPILEPGRVAAGVTIDAGATTAAVKAGSIGPRSEIAVDAVPTKPIPAAEPVRPKLPIFGLRIAAMWTANLPSTVPAATDVLEAARAPATLTSRAVADAWSRGLPTASSLSTSAIREALRGPDALASRPVGGAWGRGLTAVAPGATTAILDATRMPPNLASRSITTPWGRGLPNASPLAAADLLEAKRIPPTLASRTVTMPLNRNLPGASPVATALLLEATQGPVILASRPLALVLNRSLPAVSAARTAAIADAFAVTPPEPTIVAATALPTPSSLPSAPVAPNLGAGFSMARQLGLSVSRIVIDPGHGGHDPGAKGKGGSTEAELVLDVSLRLEKLLAKVPGVEVILTRRTDDFVPLSERTTIANREGADLFLSIHANASANDQAHGIETYFLNFANNLSAATVAARENATSGQAMGALPDFVRAIALNNKLDESRDFATLVQQSMIEHLQVANKTVKNLGVKQAPFVVLIGASMPSVLAEISFLTHEQEAKLLKSSAYRQRIAEALFDAVRLYQGSLTRVRTVAHQ